MNRINIRTLMALLVSVSLLLATGSYTEAAVTSSDITVALSGVELTLTL